MVTHFAIFLILGVSCPVLSTIIPNVSLPIVQPAPPLSSVVVQQIKNFFTFDQNQLDSLSSNLADRFGVRPYQPLTQSNLASIVQSIITAIESAGPAPSLAKLEIFFTELPDILKNKSICGVCQLLVLLIQLKVPLLLPILEAICSIYMALSTFTITEFCPQIVKINMESLSYIIDHSEIMDPQLVCSVLLQSRECNYPKPALTWVGKVDSSTPIIPKPPVADPNAKPIYMLHATDFHVSLNYEVGAVTDCGFPLCCLSGLGSSLKKGRAGAWGDYQCDCNPILVDNALSYIKSQYDISLVYHTGDVTDHYVWNTTTQYIKHSMEFVNDKFKKHFPNIPVLNVLGNHESQPMNVFAPKHTGISSAGLDQQWLYDYAAELWSTWLSGRSLETVRASGYYAYNVSSSLKVIALNNNVCYCYNWWLFFNTTFMEEGLNALQNELLESERNGQYVHIIGHNSMGNHECIYPYEDTYQIIIERFAHIIKGQFVGHTHTDEMKIFYDRNKRPINVVYNGGSLTTFQSYNPNVKVLEVDPTTMAIRNVYTYIFNLTLANLSPDKSPAWFLLYSMKEEYEMADLSPASFDNLSDRMAQDPALLNNYWLNYVRKGDAAIKAGCDDKCKKEVLCKVSRTQSLKPTKPYCST